MSRTGNVEPQTSQPSQIDQHGYVYAMFIQ